MSTLPNRIKRVIFDHPPRFSYNHILLKLFKRAPLEQFDDTHRCVFVLSTGRTGTETLASLYGLSRQVYAHHEPPPNLDLLSKLAYEIGETDEVTNRILGEGFRTAREIMMGASLCAYRGYIETSHYTTFLAYAIYHMFPQAYFLFVPRHPYDFVVSAMRRKWYSGNEHDNGRIVPRADSPHYANWQRYSTFEKNVWLWVATNQWAMEFLESLPAEKRLSIRAEDVFDADEEALKQLFTLAGLSMPSEKRLSGVLKRKINAQKTGKFPPPTEWTAGMLAFFREVVGETATQLGYELID